MNVDAAYRQCERITGSQARNFSYGIRLLEPPRRRALSAVYAMARRIDDIGDGPLPTGEKLLALAAVRAEVASVVGGAGGSGDDAVLVALGDACRRYPIPMAAFEELIEGCQMDATGTRYQTFEELVGYCRRVAGSIGRLSLGVFQATDLDRAMALADALGVALQLTNILRDLAEDRDQLGRVYVPAEDLARFALTSELDGRADDLAGLVVYEARRARAFWDQGLGLLPLLDRRSRACVAAMAGIYHRLLTRIERRPGSVMGSRLSLPGWEKAWVATRALAGAGT